MEMPERPAAPDKVNHMPYWKWAACAYALVSAVTFAVYGFDKRRAAGGGRRVPERTLHGLELLGGWPGALLGQAVFRHKRRKPRYMLVFLGIVGFHVALWVVWCRLTW
jgi:uncharacterized membrane protein YsdA (DUF1294 family)